MAAHNMWLGLSLVAFATAGQAGISTGRQQELRQMLYQDCGSCHGLTLRGGLGPALSADNLVGKSRVFLIATILHGRPGTAMPPWQGLVDEEEAIWLVDLLMSSGGATP